LSLHFKLMYLMKSIGVDLGEGSPGTCPPKIGERPCIY